MADSPVPRPYSVRFKTVAHGDVEKRIYGYDQSEAIQSAVYQCVAEGIQTVAILSVGPDKEEYDRNRKAEQENLRNILSDTARNLTKAVTDAAKSKSDKSK